MTTLTSAPARAGREIAQEGLPYWIVWLLLSLIVLLVVFIFLRDRDLRGRLNEFLSGAKKRMKRAQIRLRLDRENRLRTEAMTELGRLAWRDRIPGEAYASCSAKLSLLDEEARAKQAERQGAVARALILGRRLDEARERDKTLLADRGRLDRSGAQELDAVRGEARAMKKDIRGCEGEIRAGLAFLRAIEKRRTERFQELGNIVDEVRPDLPVFLGLYVQIDKHNRTILHHLNELDQIQ